MGKNLACRNHPLQETFGLETDGHTPSTSMQKRIWWKEHHQHPLVDSKPFPDGMVEAYITLQVQKLASHALPKLSHSQG